MNRFALLFGSLLMFSGVLMTPTVSAYQPTPQYGAFELRFGGYEPAIDDNSSLSGTPFQDAFPDHNLFLTSIEVDWQFIHPPGFSLAVGGQFGYMQAYHKVTVDDQPTASWNLLNIMPFALLAVIRVDALAEYLHVPLVPYFKIGFNWYVWWAKLSDSSEGKGGTLGWQFSPGLAFQLDFIDRKGMRTFDNEVGVNHTYVFAEFLFARVNKFGNDDYMNFSTRNIGNSTVMAGLALEF